MAFSGRMGIKEVEEMLVKNWVSTGASMDDTRKRLLCFSGIAFLMYLGEGVIYGVLLTPAFNWNPSATS